MDARRSPCAMADILRQRRASPLVLPRPVVMGRRRGEATGGFPSIGGVRVYAIAPTGSLGSIAPKLSTTPRVLLRTSAMYMFIRT